VAGLVALVFLITIAGCRSVARTAQALVFLIESSPAINLWYRDTVVVYNKRLTQVMPTPSGSFTFLETAKLVD
jgi:ABC-type transport system substrate-binding protein